MICRVWSGRTTPEKALTYEHVVRGWVIPAIEARAIPGFLQIDLLRRDTPTGSEFQTLMWFEDMDAVIAFAGPDYEAAHVPPPAAAVLADYDNRAVHFEVLERLPQSRREPHAES